MEDNKTTKGIGIIIASNCIKGEEISDITIIPYIDDPYEHMSPGLELTKTIEPKGRGYVGRIYANKEAQDKYNL